MTNGIRERELVETPVGDDDHDELATSLRKRGITFPQWQTLSKSLFPGASPQSVLLVWDYCLARKIDPMKKPCHIVPMKVKDARTGHYEWRDVVMPGIYEYRTTAQRTGQYLGHSKPQYGPSTTLGGLQVPEWCELTVYRYNSTAKLRVEFPVRTYFAEVVALKDGKPNQRWSQAPIQMLTKCCEAAALREAFPDELGGETTVEEMEGQAPLITSDSVNAPRETTLEKPLNYAAWLSDLEAEAEHGPGALTVAWQQSAQTHRAYLAATEPERWDAIKARAMRRIEMAPGVAETPS